MEKTKNNTKIPIFKFIFIIKENDIARINFFSKI